MNLEQLNAMTDLELDEAVALAQGWEIKPHHSSLDGKELIWAVWSNPDNKIESLSNEYHPTANTTEGKAQAFDLMVKYKLSITGYGKFVIDAANDITVDFGKDTLQQAIAIASILSAQEK